MVTGAPKVRLLGRQREREVLERLLEAAREGHGGVVAVYGEPGVGKTALLDYAFEAWPEYAAPRSGSATFAVGRVLSATNANPGGGRACGAGRWRRL